MSYIGSNVKRIFGLSADTTELGQALRASPGSSTQLVPETLVVGTTSRMMRGPTRNGHFSFQVIVTEASAGASAITVWYSNLPKPDPTNDAHWTQDTTIGSLALTAVTSLFTNSGNVSPEWIRFKAVVAGDTADVIVYARAEGTEN